MASDPGLEVGRRPWPRGLLAELFPSFPHLFEPLISEFGATVGDSNGPGTKKQGMMKLLYRKAARLTLCQRDDFYPL